MSLQGISKDHIDWFKNLSILERQVLSQKKDIKNYLSNLKIKSESFFFQLDGGFIGHILNYFSRQTPTSLFKKRENSRLHEILTTDGIPTKKRKLELYKFTGSEYYKNILLSITDDINNLCITQFQIAEFCEKYKKDLKVGCYYMFLFKSHGCNTYLDHYLISVIKHHESEPLLIDYTSLHDYYHTDKKEVHYIVMPESSCF